MQTRGEDYADIHRGFASGGMVHTPVDRNILGAFRANIARLEQRAEAEYQGWIQDYQKSKGTKQ
jgi:hypothetical protein